MKKVNIYSTPTCTYCQAAKEYFKEKGVEYSEFDVAADVEKRTEMVEKSGQMGVPVIDIAGTIIVGFDEELIEAALAGEVTA
jgi:glutaredoxin-like YruB-family protein